MVEDWGVVKDSVVVILGEIDDVIGKTIMIKTKNVHIITYKGVEYDRTATPWELAEKEQEGILQEYNGELTFDYRKVNS